MTDNSANRRPRSPPPNEPDSGDGRPSAAVVGQGFRKYIRLKKNEIIIGAIGFVLGPVIIGTGLALAQDALEKVLSQDQIPVAITLMGSAVAVFAEEDSRSTIQLLTYEVTATDLVQGVKVNAVFLEGTTITHAYVTYSVDLDGYELTLGRPNHAVISLAHPLDVSRTARIYMMTSRPVTQLGPPRPELPNIHVEGTDKSGDIVYR